MATEEDKILTCIGWPVCFTYPGSEGKKNGILADRSVFHSGLVGDVPYWNVIDRITFPDEPDPDFIRIGYYRKPKQKLNWGSQTTITDTVSNWRKMFVKAASEKDWFRKLLEDVMGELEKPETS